MKNINLIVPAVISAVLSTLCCLPAFLFLFFGISVGSLSFLIELDFLRVPLSIFSLVLLTAFFIKNRQNISCECENNNKTRVYLGSFSFCVVIVALLFYPEFLVYFVE